MSAPESININTSFVVLPLPKSRRVTLATGAGGSNRLESYVGIGCVFDDPFLEIFHLLRIGEVGTKRHVALRYFLHPEPKRILESSQEFRCLMIALRVHFR